jgi:hypothetical protein
MKSIKVWTDEEKLYINENFRYEPNTGLVYWKKFSTTSGPKRSTKKPTGFVESTGYVRVFFRINNHNEKLLAHRLAWYLYYGEVPTNLIDHIDHNRSNNKIDNLRESNNSKNIRHSSIQKAKVKKRKEGCCIGVYNKTNTTNCKLKKPYAAVHRIDKKLLYLGSYTTMVEAAKVRDEYAIEKHGLDCGPTNKDIGIY